MTTCAECGHSERDHSSTGRGTGSRRCLHLSADPKRGDCPCPGYAPAAQSPSYIVESNIACEHPVASSFSDADLLLRGYLTFQSLRTEWGFSVVVWSPVDPDMVLEVHWNTKAERERDHGELGRMVKRNATEREKRDGLHQHEEATRRARTPATDSPFPHPEFGQESERTVPVALQAAVNEVEALRLMSYTGGQPDLREEDVRGIRDLLIDLTLLLAERTGEPLPEAEMIL